MKSLKLRKIVSKKSVLAVLFAVFMVVGTACSTNTSSSSSGGTITLSSKGFAEQDILVNMYKLLVEKETKLDVKIKSNLTDNVLWEAFKKGDMDANVEYTGTALLQYLKKDPIYDSKKVYDEVAEQYKDQYKWTWLDPIGFNDTYALAIRQEDADKYGISTTSQLAEHSDRFVFGSAQEFLNRPDGFPAIKKTYNMNFKDVKAFGAQLDYQAISQKQVDAIIVFTTDGRIPNSHLKVLKDDKHLFLPYDAAPIVKDAVLKAHPELKDVMNKLAGKISNEQMQQLNAKVDVQHEKPEKVAKDFLTQQGFLK